MWGFLTTAHAAMASIIRMESDVSELATTMTELSEKIDEFEGEPDAEDLEAARVLAEKLQKLGDLTPDAEPSA